jgi:hypothetical protein
MCGTERKNVLECVVLRERMSLNERYSVNVLDELVFVRRKSVSLAVACSDERSPEQPVGTGLVLAREKVDSGCDELV